MRKRRAKKFRSSYLGIKYSKSSRDGDRKKGPLRVSNCGFMGFRCQGFEVIDPEISYETSGMTNVECRLTNGGIASLRLFQIGRIHYSMFDVGRSMFDVHQFLI